MCEALNNVTDEQWHEQCEKTDRIGTKTDSLLAWKNWMTGGMAALALLIGVGLWVVDSTVKRSDKSKSELVSTNKEMTKAINGLKTEMAVFHTQLQPFLLAGPRFTTEDYETRCAADKAEIKEWVRVQLEGYPHHDELRLMDSRIKILERGSN